MADPKPLDVGDWAGVVGLVGTGVGFLVAWFNKARQKINDRMDMAETRMDQHVESSNLKHAQHSTQLAVIHSNQDHLTNRLDEIRATTTTTNEKIDTLAETMTKVLLEIRRS